MEKNGLYKAYLDTHVESLIFVFLPMLQRELDEFACIWNSRHVRQSSSAPGGRPNILYHIPSTVEYCEQGFIVNDDDVSIAKNVLGTHHHPVSKNENLYEFLEIYCQLNNLQRPVDMDSAIDLYVNLLSKLDEEGLEI